MEVTSDVLTAKARLSFIFLYLALLIITLFVSPGALLLVCTHAPISGSLGKKNSNVIALYLCHSVSLAQVLPNPESLLRKGQQ